MDDAISVLKPWKELSSGNVGLERSLKEIFDGLDLLPSMVIFALRLTVSIRCLVW